MAVDDLEDPTVLIPKRAIRRLLREEERIRREPHERPTVPEMQAVGKPTMTETIVPDVLTPVTPTALYAALQQAWPNVIGGTPQRCSLLVLLAQVAEETGWHACHCWNLGNVKHVPGDGHDYCQFRASEIVGGKEVFSTMSFRAFASLDAGAVDYLTLLHRRFASAWPAVLDGDPAAFVHALKLEHYFTADEGLYSKNVVALFTALSHTIPSDPEDVSALAQNAIETAAIELGDPARSDPPPAAA